MVKRVLGWAASGLLGMGLLAASSPMAIGQKVSALPVLDLDRYMGAWYEVARLPNKREKQCVSDAVVLYAVQYKPGRFQMVTSCRIKDANYDSWNANGKRDKKSGDGRLKISYLWPFSAKYWVLAVGPEYDWAVVGSPNRKTLWVLSRTAKIKQETLAEAQSKVAAAGFDVRKLVPVQQGR